MTVYGRDACDAVARWASDWDDQVDLLLGPVCVEFLDPTGQVRMVQKVRARIVVEPTASEVGHDP